MSASYPLAHRLYGTEHPEPCARAVRLATMEFRVEGAQIRQLRSAGVEVLRSAGLVIRDAFWGTHTLLEQARTVEETDIYWRQTLEGVVLMDDGGPGLDWHLETEVRETDVLITSRLRAQADTFTTCRAGLIVLHPLHGVVGAPVGVTHSDGQTEEGHFPDLISPGQPFFDIRGLRHSPAPGVQLQWSFSGDVFEMEDQRNWSDASFKTYSRPLAWPCPYPLLRGEEVEHSVRLTVIHAQEANR